MARRDPRRAELFRRLDAACDARRGEPSSPPHFTPSSEAPVEDDQPIWPPRSRYWERYKYTLCSLLLVSVLIIVVLFAVLYSHTPHFARVFFLGFVEFRS